MPITAPLSLKVTVPCGVADVPVPVTVAVKVTDWPGVLGLAVDVTVVVLEPLTTFCVIVAPTCCR